MKKLNKPRLAIAAQTLRKLTICDLTRDELKIAAGWNGGSEDPPCSRTACTGLPN